VNSLWLEAEAILKVAKLLKADKELRLDWLENLSLVEFEEVLVANYFLGSYSTQEKIVLRISAVPESPIATVTFPSTRSVWPMAEPMEKEATDLYGVLFRDSEAMAVSPQKFKFLPDGLVGFPLRKGYSFPKEVYGLPHSRPRNRNLTYKAGSDES
jgi:NADH:ubiquinone oxidoreductase subunit C